MPTLTKREVARRTRDLMNSSGLHWTKGDYVAEVWLEDKQKEIQAFCSLGGIRKIIFGDGDYQPMDDYADPKEYALYMDTVADLATIIRRRWPEVERNLRANTGFGASYVVCDEDLVVNWNDADERTWDDVNSAFSELALMKAQKAHAPSLDQDDWL
jgi:hypothetical protein